MAAPTTDANKKGQGQPLARGLKSPAESVRTRVCGCRARGAAAAAPEPGLREKRQGVVPGVRGRRLLMLRLVAQVLLVLSAVLRRLLVRSVVTLLVVLLLLGRAGVNHGRT